MTQLEQLLVHFFEFFTLLASESDLWHINYHNQRYDVVSSMEYFWTKIIRVLFPILELMTQSERTFYNYRYFDFLIIWKHIWKIDVNSQKLLKVV